MLKIKLITTGALQEKYWKDACQEYIKRLGNYCTFSEVNFKEASLPQNPKPIDITNALEEEAKKIMAQISPKDMVIALCIEGKQYSSFELSKLLTDAMVSGTSEIILIIGSAYGLSNTIKNRANIKLSMSELTFPHQLAKVMLLETIYRSLDIAKGGKYHKA